MEQVKKQLDEKLSTDIKLDHTALDYVVILGEEESTKFAELSTEDYWKSIDMKNKLGLKMR